MHDGPAINMWDGLAIVAWGVAIGLIVGDLFTEHQGMGPLTPFGGLAGLVGAVLTSAGVARRAKEEILEQMHMVFQMGRESAVHKIHR